MTSRRRGGPERDRTQPHRHRAALLALVLPLSLFLAAGAGGIATPSARCDQSDPTRGAAKQRSARRLRAEVVAAYPHDQRAFTQGLLLHHGFLYESTGLYGQSSLRRIDPHSGVTRERADLPATHFGEGLARFGDRLVQLTWRERTALVYEIEGLRKVAELSYAGEGWGLCFDGKRFVMSDGSHRLYFRDPATFAVMSQVEVKLDGRRLPRLNELECVGGSVYANVWPTDRIVRIEKHSGDVLALIDASDLLTPEERGGLANGAVLNGIAYDAVDDTFLLTGKLWPKLLRVRFVAGDAPPAPSPHRKRPQAGS